MELKQKIVEACAMIPQEMLEKVTHYEVTKRMKKCLEVNGKKFEHLLK